MKACLATLLHARTWRRVLTAWLVCVVAPAAFAAGSCAVSSSGLAFGGYQPLTFPGKLASTDVVSTATISVICSAIATGGGYTISLGAGNYGAGDRISTRYLNNNVNGGAPMAFNAYTQASYSTVWGNGSVGALLVGAIPVGASSQSHVVYGKIPAGQNTLAAGSFSDSLTMTISYSP
jgi:spore coat protein U-like protein